MDGGDVNGGGKGLGWRFANSATPVSNLNGSRASADRAGVEEANVLPRGHPPFHRGATRGTRALEAGGGGPGVRCAANKRGFDRRIPTMSLRRSEGGPLSCWPQPLTGQDGGLWPLINSWGLPLD